MSKASEPGCAGTVGAGVGCLGGWLVYVVVIALFFGGFKEGDIHVGIFLFALIGAVLGAYIMIRFDVLGPRKKSTN